jgi:hypothetical protein
MASRITDAGKDVFTYKGKGWEPEDNPSAPQPYKLFSIEDSQGSPVLSSWSRTTALPPRRTSPTGLLFIVTYMDDDGAVEVVGAEPTFRAAEVMAEVRAGDEWNELLPEWDRLGIMAGDVATWELDDCVLVITVVEDPLCRPVVAPEEAAGPSGPEGTDDAPEESLRRCSSCSCRCCRCIEADDDPTLAELDAEASGYTRQAVTWEQTLNAGDITIF